MAKAVRACLLDELEEGQGKRVIVDGTPIAVFLIDGSPYAISDTCPHRGGPLSRGDLEGSLVRCPIHGWPFDLKTGESPVRPGQKVQTYKAFVQGEEVWVEVEQNQNLEDRGQMTEDRKK